MWRKTYTHGGAWITQYIMMSALSIYLVMQTMEAVIFRLLILSIPVWIAWSIAGRRATARFGKARYSAAPDLLSSAS